MKYAHDKIVRELSSLASRVTESRDVYFALILERDELIYQLIDQGFTHQEIAEYAGLTREQVSRMSRKR